MKILSLNIVRLPKPTIAEFGHGLIEDAEQCPTITENMQMWYGPLKTTFMEMNRIYLISHKSDYTEEIHNLIGQRYGIYAAIKGAVNSMRKSSNENTMRTATSVWNSLNSYKVNPNAQYATQTGQMDAILAILRGQQRENIEALGLTSLVENLNNLNEQVHQLIGDRDVENIDKTEGDFQNARGQFEQAYRDFVEIVNAWYLVKCITEGATDVKLQFFIEKTNSVIVRLKRTVLHISTDSPEAGDTENNPDVPQTPVTPETPDGEPIEPGEGENNGGGTNEPTTPPTEEDLDTDDDYGFDEDLK